MINKIDKAIESLASAVKGGSPPDIALKLTQSISNLSHAKLNLIEYDRVRIGYDRVNARANPRVR